jgi:adenosylcobinamide-GDP ribazoletransferase
VQELLLAVQFFTRIPITGRIAAWATYSPELLRSSAAHFPAVGWIVGLAAAGMYAALVAMLPANALSLLVAAVFSTVFTVMLTGGFHEDGLADVADGLGGSMDRERALDIMKDSRVGAFGAMALVLALLAKVALLALLGTGEPLFVWAWAPPQALAPRYWLVAAALLGGHVVSRTLPLLVIALLPHVGDTARSRSKPLADQISTGSLVIAACWCLSALLVISALLPLTQVLSACAGALVAWAWMTRLFQRRLQGFTGDCLGATQQVCEIFFYLGLAASL